MHLAAHFHPPNTLYATPAHTCPPPSDGARAVLVSMVKQLGPDYLPFVCDVLQSGERMACV
jgi:hypothetical protein